jgi:hypothetical protein
MFSNNYFFFTTIIKNDANNEQIFNAFCINLHPIFLQLNLDPIKFSKIEIQFNMQLQFQCILIQFKLHAMSFNIFI